CARLNPPAATVDALARGRTAAADTVLPGANCLPVGPPPSAPMLPTRISTFTIAARNPSERLALERLLGLGLSDTLDPGLLRSRVRQLARAEAYQAVWLAPTGSRDSVS